jgi:hypothetical protein
MLQIAKKTAFGKTIGFVVGYWFYPRRGFWGQPDRMTASFRSIREGLIFKTEKQARKFRDKIEEDRQTNGVVFEKID